MRMTVKEENLSVEMDFVCPKINDVMDTLIVSITRMNMIAILVQPLMDTSIVETTHHVYPHPRNVTEFTIAGMELTNTDVIRTFMMGIQFKRETKNRCWMKRKNENYTTILWSLENNQ